MKDKLWEIKIDIRTNFWHKEETFLVPEEYVCRAKYMVLKQAEPLFHGVYTDSIHKEPNYPDKPEYYDFTMLHKLDEVFCEGVIATSRPKVLICRDDNDIISELSYLSYLGG